MLCWSAGKAAWLHQPLLILSWRAAHLQIFSSLVAKASNAWWRAVVWPSVNLRFLFCSLGMGISIAGKQSLCLAPLWADLAEAMHCPPACLPACQPARSLAELPLPSLESWWCDSLSVQIKCHWADFTAAALFHQDGRSRAREQPVGMWVFWCCSFCLGVQSFLPWPFSVLGRAEAP